MVSQDGSNFVVSRPEQVYPNTKQQLYTITPKDSQKQNLASLFETGSKSYSHLMNKQSAFSVYGPRLSSKASYTDLIKWKILKKSS